MTRKELTHVLYGIVNQLDSNDKNELLYTIIDQLTSSQKRNILEHCRKEYPVDVRISLEENGLIEE